MTEAMFDWLEDERAEHPLRLEQALVEMNVIRLYREPLPWTRS